MPNSHFKIWALRNNIQRIKVLSLRGVVGWGTKLKLANLRELKLSQSGFSAMRLMESLTEAPLLQSLIIEDPRLQRAPDDDEILRGIAVELAFLSRIELQAVTASFAHTTLSKITPPSLKQLIIAISIFDVPAFSLDNLGADYRRLVRSLMEAQGSLPIPIRVVNKIQRLALSDSATRRDFELSGVDLSDKGKTRCAQCIRDFIRGWSSSSDPSFTLEFGPMTSSQTADYRSYVPLKVFEALMEIEGVSKIRVGRGVGIKQLYYQLQLSHTVVHETGQSQRWLLPQLAILEIEGQDDLDRALVRMLKGRYAAATSHGDIVLPLPFSMVKLVRDYGREPEPTIAAEIRNIIGEEHLCIEML